MSDVFENLLSRAAQSKREERFEDAQRDLTEAVELCRPKGSRAQLAHTLRLLGEVERNLPASRDAALRHYEEAVALYRADGPPLKLAHTVRHLGDIHYEQERPEAAEPCFNEALALYRSQPEHMPLDLANAIRSLAVLKSDAGENEPARQLWEEARDLYAASDVMAGVAESSARLAVLAGLQDDAEQARQLLHEARKAAEVCGEPDLLRYVSEVEAALNE